MWEWHTDAILDYNYGMKAMDLSDKILKSYEMNRKTLHWPTKLVFHMTNMAMMNVYLLWRRSQQMELQGIILQEQRVKKLPELRQDQQLHSHTSFCVKVIMALIEEGNKECTYCNPSMQPLTMCLECRFNDCHFPEEIIPSKNGHTCIGGVLPTTRNQKAKTLVFVVFHARSSCVHGLAWWCITQRTWPMKQRWRCMRKRLSFKQDAPSIRLFESMVWVLLSCVCSGGLAGSHLPAHFTVYKFQSLSGQLACFQIDHFCLHNSHTHV